VRQALVTRVNKEVYFGDLPMGVQQVKSIARVVARGLTPLREAVLKYSGACPSGVVPAWRTTGFLLRGGHSGGLTVSWPPSGLAAAEARAQKLSEVHSPQTPQTPAHEAAIAICIE
jgi:hypothetical protein